MTVRDGAELSTLAHGIKRSKLLEALRYGDGMEICSANVQCQSEYQGMAPGFFEPRWYAAYTSANHEKRVGEQLRKRSIKHFLPLYDLMRRWKDRRMKLQLPLFPGYVFIHLALRDRLQVLQVPGVVRLVGFNGTPCALPQKDIETIQNFLDRGCHVEPHPYFSVGSRVRIVRGPLEGVEGILARKKNLNRVVLTLDLIARSVAVEVGADDVERIL